MYGGGGGIAPFILKYMRVMYTFFPRRVTLRKGFQYALHRKLGDHRAGLDVSEETVYAAPTGNLKTKDDIT